MNPARVRMLVALVVAQLVLLAGIPALEGARIAAGTHVDLAVVPVDPLDLARGAYVDLEYEIAELELPAGVDDGDDVWVQLVEPYQAGAAWQGVRVVDDLDVFDRDDVFLRATALDGRVDLSEITTYYASADEAQQLEYELADGGIATVSLDGDGSPTLVDVRGG